MPIIKIGSKTCGPCMRVEQLLNQLNKEYISLDIHEDDDAVGKYNVRNIPTVIKVDDDGIELARLTMPNCINKQLLEKL